MQPNDLALFRSYGRPAIAADGRAIAALTTPNVTEDRYEGVLHALRPSQGAAHDLPPVQLSRGPRDSAPVISPNGALIVFLRAGAAGPAQLYAMARDGGEPFPLADHPLGASEVAFAPDGRSIAYLAPVPDAGRYADDEAARHGGDGPAGDRVDGLATGLPSGRKEARGGNLPRPAAVTGSDAPRGRPTAEPEFGGGPKAEPGSGVEAAATGPAAAGAVAAVTTARAPATGGPGSGRSGPQPEAEAPRRVTALNYRSDGRGFTGDKREQIFVLDLVAADGSPMPESRPRQLTAEVVPIGRPTFTPDGRQIVYDRLIAVDTLQAEIAAVPADAAAPTRGRSVVIPGGDVAKPVVVGETIYYVGTLFAGHDFAGRTPGLWAVPLAGGTPRRLTDVDTVHVDADAGDPAPWKGSVLVAVADRGTVTIRAVPVGAAGAPLADLPVVIGGRRVVTGFAVAGEHIAATVATPTSCGDVVVGTIDGLLAHGTAAEQIAAHASAPLRAAGVRAITEIDAAAPDGYPVHGFLVLPAGEGPHPTLLMLHGGPHTQYGWGLFDEAQMYAAAGYAVVLPNPRGSAGYGQAHGRALVGALGTVDVDDVMALLDAALERDDLDPGRVGVMGGSYGGFLTSWLVSHTSGRFVAAISERAVNAWDSFVGTSDIGYFFVDAYVGASAVLQRAKSPLKYADRIALPVLIIHSEQDWRCPMEQAQRLFTALKMRGAAVEMLLFPGEGHELSRSGRPRHRVQRFEAILEWWGRYLPVG